MTFKDTYISGPFLARLYDALRDSRGFLRSELYSDPCPKPLGDFDEELFRLLLIMEEISDD